MAAAYHVTLKKQHEDKMLEHNEAAMKAIIDPQRSSDGGWGNMIDLHGLFVKEAISTCNDFLNYHMTNFNLKFNLHLDQAQAAEEEVSPQERKQLCNEEYIIITGAGHHSTNNVAKLRPEIEKMLELRQRDMQDMNHCINFSYVPLQGDGGFKVILSTKSISQDISQGIHSVLFESATFESQELE